MHEFIDHAKILNQQGAEQKSLGTNLKCPEDGRDQGSLGFSRKELLRLRSVVSEHLSCDRRDRATCPCGETIGWLTITGDVGSTLLLARRAKK